MVRKKKSCVNLSLNHADFMKGKLTYMLSQLMLRISLLQQQCLFLKCHFISHRLNDNYAFKSHKFQDQRDYMYL